MQRHARPRWGRERHPPLFLHNDKRRRAAAAAAAASLTNSAS